MRTFFVLLILCLIPSAALAQWEWTEEFITDEYVDLTESNAYIYIDPEGGYAELPTATGTAGLELRGIDQVLLTTQGIEYFVFDGEMVKNPYMSVDGTGTGIAVQQESYTIWLATDQDVTRFEYGGGGMTENDFMKVSGLKNILSIASQDHEDQLAVLSRTETGHGRIEVFLEAETLVSFKAEDLTGNPVDIAVVPDTLDIIYATENAVAYYHFDPETLSYIQNPVLSITGLSDVKALNYQDGSYVLLRAGQKEHYMFTGEDMARVDALTHTVPEGTVSLAVSPGTYDFAVLDQTGKTHYYNYSDDGYILNEFLSAQGAPVEEGYYSPRRYYSKPIILTEDVSVLLLSATENKPSGTAVKYYLIAGGEDEEEIVPGSPFTLDEGTTTLVLVAELSTAGPNTPRVTRIHLQGITLKIQSIKIETFPVHPDFEHLESPYLIYPEFAAGFPAYYLSEGQLIEPIPIQQGGMVVFEVEAMGEPDSVELHLVYREDAFSQEALSLPLSHLVGDKWVSTLAISLDQPVGAEYWLSHAELRSGEQVVEEPESGYMHNPFLQVSYDIDLDMLNFFNVRLTK